MPVFVSMLRGVNVGGHRRISMEALRRAYAERGLREARTILQSGNVVFRTRATDAGRLGARIEAGLAAAFGLAVDVILRTAAELDAVIAANPFAAEAEAAPSRLLVLFLRMPLAEPAAARLEGLRAEGERLAFARREAFLYFAEGAGRSRLAQGLDPRHLGGPATARNWNTVRQLAEVAHELESA